MSGVEDQNGMLTQEALDAMLAEAGAASDGLDEFESDEPIASQAAGLAEASAAAEKATASPGLSFVSYNDLPKATGGTGAGFERVQDISLEIAVELGRTRLLIKDILELTSGSIIELEKIAGEPVDLLANGLLIARGEVVVVEDSFGVRITQVITADVRKELANETLHKSLS
jgi:flagellar motor switch protein FliN/FliY